MCRSDHRRQQLIGQLTGITVAVQPPRTRAVHESPALSDVGIAPKRCRGLWRFVDPLLEVRSAVWAICVVEDEAQLPIRLD
jgi:hypothetical protein